MVIFLLVPLITKEGRDGGAGVSLEPLIHWVGNADDLLELFIVTHCLDFLAIENRCRVDAGV